MVDNPITRKEKYLAKLTGSYTGNVPDPITRVEKYLYDLCQKGISGLTPEEIENAVNKYLKENPVQPGATEEQAQQIKKNTNDVASLKEDLSTKITKFYASNQGETHITDSDNGKIQDMMIYGKSSQDGTPSPENPVEIKSVVNPTIKICGKNLFDSKKFPIILNRAIDTNTGVVYESSSGKYCATEKYIPFPYGGKIISFNASMSLYAYDKDYKFISAIRYHSQAPFGTTYVRFDIKIEDKDKAQIELSESTTTYEPYHEQTVTLPYTLNAIPVNSDGNVTIDGQQYIADYVDVERGKLVRMVGEFDTKDLTVFGRSETDGVYRGYFSDSMLRNFVAGNSFRTKLFDGESTPNATRQYSVYMDKNNKSQWLNFICDSTYRETADLKSFIQNTGTVYGIFETPTEIDLTSEEVQAFKALATYYPVTNIFINSEQLDGYTVFNYPISMANIITSLETKTENLESANYTDRGTLADTDAFLINDGTGMKKSVLSKLSDFVLNKIADKVFEKLQTNDKTILGAINELNSNTLPIFKEFTITLNSNISNFADGNGCNNGANMCVYSNLLHIISLNLNILNSTSDYIFTINKKEHFPKNNTRLIFTSESGAVNAMPFIQSSDGKVRCDGTIPSGKAKITVIYMTNQ